MNYSDIISRAFRTLKKGSLWGFVVSTYGATLLLFVAATVFAVLAAGPSLLSLFRGGASSGLVDRMLPSLLAIIGVFTLALLLAIPLSLIAYGGLIHQTDEAQAGRDASVGDAWRFGARRMGRVFLVELVLGLVAFALTLVGVIPIVLVIAASSGSRNSGAGIVFGVCGGGLVLLLLVFALWMLGAFEALSIRYALIGDRTASDAIGAGWQAFRARFGNVFMVLLILLAFRLVVGIIQQVLSYALQFAGLGSAGLANTTSPESALRSATTLMRAAPIFLIIYLVTFIVALAWRVFDASLWTAFFRQLTGLSQPPAPAYSAYGQPPTGGTPSAPLSPSGYPPSYSPPGAPSQSYAPPTAPVPYEPPPVGPPMAPQPAPAPAPEPAPAPRPPEQ